MLILFLHKGRLRLDFKGHRRYVYRVHPVAGAMPLQSTNWKCIHEGTSTKLDLPLSCKGFIFILSNGGTEFAVTEEIMLQNILIAGVVAFVNGNVNNQSAISTAYPLLVPLERSRTESSVSVINSLAAAYEAFWSATIDPTLFFSPGMNAGNPPMPGGPDGSRGSNTAEAMRRLALLEIAALGGFSKKGSDSMRVPPPPSLDPSPRPLWDYNRTEDRDRGNSDESGFSAGIKRGRLHTGDKSDINDRKRGRSVGAVDNDHQELLDLFRNPLPPRASAHQPQSSGRRSSGPGGSSSLSGVDDMFSRSKPHLPLPDPNTLDLLLRMPGQRIPNPPLPASGRRTEEFMPSEPSLPRPAARAPPSSADTPTHASGAAALVSMTKDQSG